MKPSYELFEQLPKTTREKYREVRAKETIFDGHCVVCFNKPVRMFFKDCWLTEEDNYLKALTCSEPCYQYILLLMC